LLHEACETITDALERIVKEQKMDMITGKILKFNNWPDEKIIGKFMPRMVRMAQEAGDH